MIAETKRNGLPGIPTLILLLAIIAGCIAALIWSDVASIKPVGAGLSLLAALAGFFLRGLFTVSPNQGRVQQLFARILADGLQQAIARRGAILFHGDKRFVGEMGEELENVDGDG